MVSRLQQSDYCRKTGNGRRRLTKVRKFGHEGALEMFIAAPHEFGE
jgi:hypothetical protein